MLDRVNFHSQMWLETAQSTRHTKESRKMKMIGFLAVAGVGLTLGLKFAFPVLAPFFLGLFFAGLIEPLVRICELRLGLRRPVATPLFLVLLLLLVLTLVTLTLILTYQEVQHLWKLIPLWGGRLTGLIRRWLSFFQPCFPDLQHFAKSFFNPELFSQISRPLLIGIVSSLPRFPQIIAAILLGVVSAFFFSRDKYFLLALLAKWLPSGYRQSFRVFCREVTPVLARFMWLECALVVVTMVVTFACLSILGVDRAPAYGWLAGVFDLVPVLGPGLIYLPILLSCLLVENYWGAAGVLGSYFLLLIIRQTAELKICGADLNIHPLLTLIVIYLGMKCFGLLGFFLGPVLVLILRSCYRAFQVKS